MGVWVRSLLLPSGYGIHVNTEIAWDKILLPLPFMIFVGGSFSSMAMSLKIHERAWGQGSEENSSVWRVTLTSPLSGSLNPKGLYIEL